MPCQSGKNCSQSGLVEEMECSSGYDCTNPADPHFVQKVEIPWTWGPPRTDGRCGPQNNADCSNTELVVILNAIVPCCTISSGQCGTPNWCDGSENAYDFRGILQLPHIFCGDGQYSKNGTGQN